MMKPGKTALWVVLASATTTVMAGSIISPVLNVMGEGLKVDPGAAFFVAVICIMRQRGGPKGAAANA